MANYHTIDIQCLAIKMINGDTQAENQIINYYSDYINNTVDRIFKDIECDKDLIKEKLLQRFYNYINDYKNIKDNYFSHYACSYILSGAKLELKKIRNREELKNREMQKLAERMINGDNDALNQIIEFYTLRIKKLVRDKYSHVNYDEDDLIQIGIMGLLKAIDLYKLEKKSHFSTYASKYINKEIERELTLSNKTINIEYIGLNNNHNSKVFDNFIESTEVKEAIKKLSNIKKKILFLYIYGKYTFEDIADIFGFSYQRAHEHYKKAIDSIKQELDLPSEKQKKL